MRPLAACSVALIGLLGGLVGFELRAEPAATKPPASQPAAMPTPPLDVAAATDETASVDAILARPLFAPGRRPAAPIQTVALPPRLAGLVLAPSLHLALLQVGDAEGRRPLPVGQGGEISGWHVVRIDAAGVLLRRDGRTLELTLRQAGAREVPPMPIDQMVLMPEKRINPQLAW